MTTAAPLRTEVEAVSDAVCALLAARLLEAHQGAVVEACRVAGITLGDLNDARIRAENGRARPARRVGAWPNVVPRHNSGGGAPYARPAAPTPYTQPGRQRPVGWAQPGRTAGSDTKLASVPRSPDPGRDQSRRLRNGPPRPARDHTGEQFCATCGLWLPFDDFSDGKATCRACLNSRRRQRYLSVARAAELEHMTVRYLRAVGDPAVHCGACGKAIDVDAECVMVGAVQCGGCAGV